MTDLLRLPRAGEEFTDDCGETRVVASIEAHDDVVVIFDRDGDAVIVAKARFVDLEGV